MVYQIRRFGEAVNTSTPVVANASKIEQKTNGISHSILKRLGLAESTPIQKFVALGATYGSVIPLVGTGIGALIGFIVASVKRYNVQKELRKLITFANPKHLPTCQHTIDMINAFLLENALVLTESEKSNLIEVARKPLQKALDEQAKKIKEEQRIAANNLWEPQK
jgi:gas vesicle protein